MKRFLCLFIFILSLVTGAASAFAQDPNNLPPGASADVIQEKKVEEAKESLLTPKSPAKVEVPETQKTAAPDTGPRFFVDRILLEGEGNLVPYEDLQPLLKPFEGREITFKDLLSASSAIESYYRTKGYFAVVVVPPQKINNKQARLQIIVSRMGDLSIEGIRYFRESLIRPRWRIPRGEYLRYDGIRESILDMSENPDKTVKPVLKAGANPGTTDIVLRVEDKIPVHGGYVFDNQGSKATGKLRHGFTAQHNNLLSIDDRFQIGTVFGDAFGALFFNHLIPLNRYGTRFLYGFSHAQVTPEKEFDAFGINGISQNYNMSVRQRLWRGQKLLAEAYLGYDIKEKTTVIQNTTTVWDRLRVFSWGGTAQVRDKQGFWSIGQDFSYGFPFQGDGYALHSRGGESQFFKYEPSISRIQKLPWDTRAVIRFSAQFTNSRLVSSEQFFLGGASTVRGYPESDYAADQGLLTRGEYWVPFYLAPAEWKIPYDTVPLRKQCQLLGFVDHGYGWVKNAAENESRSRRMLGVGAGFEIKFRTRLTARFEWGVPLLDEQLTESGPSQFHFRLSTDL